MNPITINTGKAELLLVKLPERAKNLFMHKDKLFWVIDKHPWGGFEKLPSKTWKILGNPFDFTEEQCNEIMPLIDRVYGSSYIDYGTTYKNLSHGYTGSAKGSFNSLLRANNIYRENPFGEKPHETFNHPEWEYIRAKWQDAENNVGNWICLIKVKES